MINLKRSLAKRLEDLARRLDPDPLHGKMPPPKGPQAHEIPGRFVIAPPQTVDVEAPPEAMRRLVEQTAAAWRKLGEDDAHWSVISAPEFQKEALDEELFFETGAHDFRVLTAFFNRSGMRLPFDGRVLELGCGVGRVTRQFATRFAGVTGLDISPPHLALARSQLDEAGLTDVDLVHLTSLATVDEQPQVALFYSLIVLQHNPPPVALDLLRRCLGRVAGGGFAFFQVPTYKADYHFTLPDYQPDAQGLMEMHVVPQPRILALLDELDFQVLEVQEDGCVGSVDMVSHTFFARRR